jgi:site-specific DNA recombinase
MRAAIYARVSTQKQEKNQTIDSQLTALKQWVQDHSHHLLPEHIFRDEGYSGSRLDRPGLDALRDEAQEGVFDLIVVLSPDRLARKYAYQVILLEELRRRGCEVIFLHHPISDNPNDQFLLQIQAAMAEYERVLLGERFRRGKLQKAREGFYCGTKPAYGYSYLPKQDGGSGHLVINDAEAEVVRIIYQWLVDEQMTVRQIIKRLNLGPWVPRCGRSVWSNSVIHHILSDPIYSGTAYANRYCFIPAQKPRRRGPNTSDKTCRRLKPQEEWVAIAVPPIISKELFDLAQAQLARNRVLSFRNNRKYNYLLRCLLRCGTCGLAMFGRTRPATARQGERRYYQCRGKDWVLSGRAEACPQPTISAEALESAVWNHLVHLMSDPQQLIEQFQSFLQVAEQGNGYQQAEAAKLQAQIDRTSREEKRLLDAYQAELISLEEFAKRKQQVVQRREVLTVQQQQQSLLREQQLKAEEVLQDLKVFQQRIKSRLTEASLEEKQAILQLLIERIIVGEDSLEIQHVIPLRGLPEDGSDPDPPKWRLCSDGVHDAQLHLGLGKDRLDSFGKAFQAIHTGDENVLHTTILQFRHHRQPEFSAFCLCHPNA